MGDQINNYELNFAGQGNHYHQSQYNMMYHQNMNQAMNQYMANAHNNIPPHTFSPGVQYGAQTHPHMQASQQQNLINQQNHMLYMQQQSQTPQNQQQASITNLASKNSIEGIPSRMSQQHDNQIQQNKNMNVRINHGVASFPHITQPNHIQQQQQNHINPNNGSHAVINNSPPPQSQGLKARQQQQLYSQGSAQHAQQAQIQDSQYSNEENQDVLSHVSNTNNNNNNHQGLNKPLLEHLELSHFKVEQCNNTNSHNHKQCKYFHTNKDKRRIGVNYTSDPCMNPQNCQDGENCSRAHNKVEELYCPDKYKTKFCTCYPNNCHNCEYGSYCSFAHNESDIKIDLIENYQFDEDFYVFYYKTVWCPFNFIKHDKAQCVYSHNWQDYRRRPQDYNYEPVSCPNWKPGNYITKYEEGCFNKFDCNKCHGWKESEYHPRNYRTKQCTQTTNNEKCNKGPQCPYYHNAQEKRNVPQSIQDGLFKYRPRNRNIRNTYKTQSGQTPNDSQPFTSARINQLNSTQSLPDHHSNLQTFTGASSSQKHQPTCQSPTIIQQEQIVNTNTNHSNGKQNVPVTNKKPMKLNTTSQLEFPNKKNSTQVNNDDANYYDMNKFNEEQCESIQGIMSETVKWGQINGNTNTPQQLFQIFQNQPPRINNTKSFDNFNLGPEFVNNNQYYQNNQNNFQTNNMVPGGQINPEINEIAQQIGQFSLQNYDNSECDFI